MYLLFTFSRFPCYNNLRPEWARRAFFRRFSVPQSLRHMIVWDKAFVKRLATVALPIMFLNLVTSCIGVPLVAITALVLH